MADRGGGMQQFCSAGSVSSSDDLGGLTCCEFSSGFPVLRIVLQQYNGNGDGNGNSAAAAVQR